MMFVDDVMFSIIPIIVGCGFLFVFCMIIYSVISTIKQGVKNNNSPLLTVPTQVVTKRTEVKGDRSYTTYYVTFEVQSGDRIELTVAGDEYGILVEKDLGLLSFQGTRFISFKRN